MGATQHSGAMVACYLPPRLAKSIAVAGGVSPADLHLTIAYVKDPSPADIVAMRDACRAAAAAIASPIRGRFAGVGRFSASETSDGQDVHYASLDAPDLHDARHAVASMLSARGLTMSRAHGFTPHVTLAYSAPDADSPIKRISPVEVALSGLWLAQGDVRCGFYPFGARAPAASSIATTKADRVVKLLSPEGEAEEQFVLGLVLEPDVVDGHGDTYSGPEIRKTAHGYMERFQQLDIQHSFVPTDRMKLVESFLAPCDMTVGGRAIKAGTWLIGVHVIDAALWGDIKAGRFTGFSIGGTADRERLTPAA